jgi:outer membrane protein, multidrug efflux system
MIDISRAKPPTLPATQQPCKTNMNNLRTRLLPIASFAAVLAGCNTPGLTPYQRPNFELPQLSSAPIADRASSKTEWSKWWVMFNDPVLEGLLQEASAANQDLVIAAARIDEARATLDSNRTNQFPTLDLNANMGRRGASDNTANARPGAATSTSDWQFGLTAAYELDFWGKYARADDAARARLMSQTANRGAVFVALNANLVQAYFALRATDAQIVLNQAILTTRTENLRLQTRRAQAGLSSDLDLRQAESEAASVESALRGALQVQKNLETALSILLGRPPIKIGLAPVARGADLKTLYARASLPADLPSDLLNRRPDLIAAEQLLIASQADIALARTAYYPRIALSAGLGQQSTALSDLLKPASVFWSLLGNLAQPIFRAGAVDAAVAAATAREKQAVAQYTQAVQFAFKDTQDALNNYAASRDLVEINQKRVIALEDTLRLAQVRYNGGYSNYLEVLSASRDLALAQNGLIDLQRAQLNALVALFRAIGGGV